MCRRGRHFEIVRALEDERKDTFARMEELAEVIATELGTRQLPPVVERIDIRIAAHGVGDEFLAPIGPALTTFGQETHALILDEDDTTLVDHRFGEHGPQVGAVESNRHGFDLQGKE